MTLRTCVRSRCEARVACSRERRGDQNNNFRAGAHGGDARREARVRHVRHLGTLRQEAQRGPGRLVAAHGDRGQAGPEVVRHLPLPLDEGQREAGDDDNHGSEAHDEEHAVHRNRRRRAVFLRGRRARREGDEGRGQKPRREHADQQREDARARLRDEEALDVERRDGLDVEIHHGEEARRRRHLDERPLAQQGQALEQGRRAAPAPDERADPEHERVLEEGPEPDEEPDAQPVGELALAAGAEVIFLFEELGLDRVGDGLGHEALELAHGARVEEELVLVLEDALAE